MTDLFVEPEAPQASEPSEAPRQPSQAKKERRPDPVAVFFRFVWKTIVVTVATPFGLAAAFIAILAGAALFTLAGGLIWSLLVSVLTAALGLLFLLIAFIAAALVIAVVAFFAFGICLSLWSGLMGSAERKSGRDYLNGLTKSLKN